MRCLILLAGSSTCSRPARWALRIRVKRSAIGSVRLIFSSSGQPYLPARWLDVACGLRLAACGRPCRCPRAASRGSQAGPRLPRRLDHSGHLALQGAVAEADAAHLELVQEGAAPPADGAAVVGPHLELGLQREALCLGDLGQLG